MRKRFLSYMTCIALLAVSLFSPVAAVEPLSAGGVIEATEESVEDIPSLEVLPGNDASCELSPAEGTEFIVAGDSETEILEADDADLWNTGSIEDADGTVIEAGSSDAEDEMFIGDTGMDLADAGAANASDSSAEDTDDSVAEEDPVEEESAAAEANTLVGEVSVGSRHGIFPDPSKTAGELIEDLYLYGSGRPDFCWIGSETCWYEGSRKMNPSEKFITGKKYSFYITVYCEEGYALTVMDFDIALTCSFTDIGRKTSPQGLELLYLRSEEMLCANVIDRINVQGFQLPTTTQSPEQNASGLSVNGGGFSIASVRWFLDGSSPREYLYDPYAFQVDQKYCLEITVRHDDGYVFSPNLKIFLNGVEGAIDPGTLLNNGKDYRMETLPILPTHIYPPPGFNSVSNVNDGVKLTWYRYPDVGLTRIYRKNSGGYWVKVVDTTKTSYTVTGLTSGTDYTFTLRYMTADGKTYQSGYEIGGTTIKYIAPPAISSVAGTYNGVIVRWTASAGAERYSIYRKTPGGSWKKVGSSTSTSFIDKTAVSGTTYAYTVRCVNAAGTAVTSGYDTVGKTVTYYAAPTISSLANTASGIKVTWNAIPGVTKYRVFYKTTGGVWKKAKDTSATSCTVGGLTSNTAYTFTVRCLDSTGTAYISSYNPTGKSLRFFAAPKISFTKVANVGVQLKWTAIPGIKKYVIYRKTKTGSWVKKAVVTGVNAWTDKTMTKNTPYYYAVRCMNSAGTALLSGYLQSAAIQF